MTLFLEFLGALVRFALTGAGTWLVAKHVITAEQSVRFLDGATAGALMLLSSLAWSLWQKLSARLTLKAALELPAYASEARAADRAKTNLTMSDAFKASGIVLAAVMLAASVTACASLPVKERGVKSSQAAEIALGAADDFERAAFLAGSIPQLSAMTTCSPALAPAPPACTVHQKVSVLLAKAFNAQHRAGVLIQKWRAGEPPPSDLIVAAADLQDAIAAIGEATSGTRAGDLVAKIQAVLDEVSQLAVTMGGGQ